MKNLTAERSCIVVKLSDVGGSNLPLQEQLRPLVNVVPFLIIDVDGISFTSMMLGEMVNLYMAFQDRWGSRANGLAMIRAPEVTKQVLRIAKLTDKIPVFDDMEQAWRSFGTAPRAAKAQA
jgi:hypothetical protein